MLETILCIVTDSNYQSAACIIQSLPINGRIWCSHTRLSLKLNSYCTQPCIFYSQELNNCVSVWYWSVAISVSCTNMNPHGEMKLLLPMHHVRCDNYYSPSPFQFSYESHPILPPHLQTTSRGMQQRQCCRTMRMDLASPRVI